MPLKLRVSRGDHIHIGEDCVLTIRTHTDHKVMVEVNAPEELEVFTRFADAEKQHKNVRKAQVSPEEQERRKLQNLRRAK